MAARFPLGTRIRAVSIELWTERNGSNWIFEVVISIITGFCEEKCGQAENANV